MSESIDRILYGKQNLDNIVNISVKDNIVYIFREVNNELYVREIPFEYWVLSPKYAPGCQQLKGNQHYQYIKTYSNEEDFLKIKPNIYKHKLYHINHKAESFMVKEGYTYFKNMKPSDVSILSWDIETSGLKIDAPDAKVFLITNTFRSKSGIIRKTFNVDDYKSDVHMIQSWINWVNEIDPTFICGHNIVMYDFPYIANIMERAGKSINLGRDGSAIEIESRERELRKDGSQSYSYKRINIFGREVIDTFFLAIKYDIGRKYDSYGLKSIIRQEGLEKEGRTFIDASKIAKQWNDLEKKALIVKYAEEDSDDALKLFDMMCPSLFYFTRYIPKPFQIMLESATGSQLNALMVRSYIQDGYAVAQADETGEFEGAISLGNPGIFRNCVKWDVASLYPSIMLEYKIESKSKDFNGNFQKVLTYLRDERLKNKKLAKDTGDRYYDDMQNTQKVGINSLYGFMGASGLNYNYPKGAAEVTRKGREILDKAIKWATGNCASNYKEHTEIKVGRFLLVNADTDSITVCKNNMEEFSQEEMDSLLEELNSLYPDNISWEDDGYYKTLICLKAKNYILYDGKKIKTKGSSLKDAKKESALREMLDVMIKAIIEHREDELVTIYHNYIREALNPTDIKRWCQKKTITKAVLDCATNEEARKNERDVYDAIKNSIVQEGDKVYVYPAIISCEREETVLKNGKTRVKETKVTGLRRYEDFNGDHDKMKLVDRVVATVDILKNVVNSELFIDYTLKKNIELLETL